MKIGQWGQGSEELLFSLHSNPFSSTSSEVWRWEWVVLLLFWTKAVKSPIAVKTAFKLSPSMSACIVKIPHYDGLDLYLTSQDRNSKDTSTNLEKGHSGWYEVIKRIGFVADMLPKSYSSFKTNFAKTKLGCYSVFKEKRLLL